MITKNKPGRPAGMTGKARAITDKELSITLKVAEQSRHAKRNIAILILSNYLGLRAQEIALLKVGDVFDGNEIKTILRLIGGYCKGGQHRDICIENAKVIKALEEYIVERKKMDADKFSLKAPLFRSERGGAFSPNAMARVFINLYADAGITSASSHTGRRSLITKLAYQGVSLCLIKQIAGHKNITTTMQYVEDNPQMQRNVLIDL